MKKNYEDEREKELAAKQIKAPKTVMLTLAQHQYLTLTGFNLSLFVRRRLDDFMRSEGYDPEGDIIKQYTKEIPLQDTQKDLYNT